MTHATSKQHSTPTVHSDAACGEDLKRILGDIDASKLSEILALKPTLAVVEEAALWANGDGDVLAKSGHPLTGVIAKIVDILTAEEESEPTL